MARMRYGEMAAWFRVLSHPVRLQLLGMLCQGERCVGELQAALHKPQPYVSQQLRLLRMSRLVACRRCGQFAYYRLADSRAQHVLRRLCPAPPAGCNGSSKPRVAKAVKR